MKWCLGARKILLYTPGVRNRMTHASFLSYECSFKIPSTVPNNFKFISGSHMRNGMSEEQHVRKFDIYLFASMNSDVILSLIYFRRVRHTLSKQRLGKEASYIQRILKLTLVILQ
jgi:hypothetical protein